jgi:hypothetical protein
MDEKVDILMAAIRAIVDGESGSWQEKRGAVLAKMDSDDAGLFWEFINWFHGEH